MVDGCTDEGWEGSLQAKTLGLLNGALKLDLQLIKALVRREIQPIEAAQMKKGEKMSHTSAWVEVPGVAARKHLVVANLLDAEGLGTVGAWGRHAQR